MVIIPIEAHFDFDSILRSNKSLRSLYLRKYDATRQEIEAELWLKMVGLYHYPGSLETFVGKERLLLDSSGTVMFRNKQHDDVESVIAMLILEKNKANEPAVGW